MIPVALALGVLLPLLQQAAEPPEVADVLVSSALEELRKTELLLDADGMAAYLAHSFTSLEESTRLSGSFAYLEPMRQLRQRHGEVLELRFDEIMVRVYGASAVASYRFAKTWREPGARHREAGWCTDVFERRDDGAWILVHRHRAR